ncbi:MAG: ATP-binding protein [Desulfobulbaceae bacterium]
MIYRKFTPRRAVISSWIVIGMSCIMVVAVSLLAVFNYNRGKRDMQKLLSEKGAALIKSFEAGTRTGMMGRFGTGSRLQTLLTETASQEDILYIVLVDGSGRILAHNDPEQIGSTFVSPHTLEHLAPEDTLNWRTIHRDGKPVAFEVYRRFLPSLGARGIGETRRGRRFMHEEEGGVWCQPGWMEGLPQERILDPEERPVIFIGMDAAPYVEAMRKDFGLTLMTTGIILLLGMAGVVSLFWAQSYSRSRKLLQDSRAFAAEMVANLPEGIIVADPRRKISFFNGIAGDMLGLTTTGTIGRHATEVLPEDLKNMLETVASSREKILEKETILPAPDGSELILAVSVTDIVSEDGNSVGTMFILRDLTQIRRLQATVQKQEKMAAIGNLAAGVAHEVRNPLSSIKGYATYFGSLFPAESEQKKAAEVMSTEVERLNRVISELLEIARPSDLKPKETDLPFLITSSLRLVRQDAEAAGVTIRTFLDERMKPLTIDPDRITQGLLNLYINSIQAMPGGGELSVTARDHDDTVELTIADTGTGIPEEVRTRMFDPYFTTKNTGTGLGLAVVQKVFEAHGATITVTGREGNGTVFTIVIPRDRKQEKTI